MSTSSTAIKLIFNKIKERQANLYKCLSGNICENSYRAIKELGQEKKWKRKVKEGVKNLIREI